jgi:hypothetical protein
MIGRHIVYPYVTDWIGCTIKQSNNVVNRPPVFVLGRLNPSIVLGRLLGRRSKNQKLFN